MPILATSGGDDENDPYDVIFSPDVDSTSSPFCDDVFVTSSTSCRPEVCETETENDAADDVEQDSPKKRGPKKQPMTKARQAKVKVHTPCLSLSLSFSFSVFVSDYISYYARP